MYELRENGTDVPEHEVAVKDHTFKSVSYALNWLYKLILNTMLFMQGLNLFFIVYFQSLFGCSVASSDAIFSLPAWHLTG